MNNKILIIGSNGMLGSELMKVFSECNVVGLDKKDIDITQEEEIDKKIKELNPNFVINAAAYTDVDGCETNHVLAEDVNGKAVGYLAKSVEKIGAIFVQYSTDYVFDGEKKDGYAENDEPENPVNFYGKSKLLGEKLLKENCKRYYLIRTSWLFGKNGKNFIDTILKLSKEKEEINVVNDQYGKPTYAVDLAQKTKELIFGNYPFGRYHITNEGETTWYNFAINILEVFKLLNPQEKFGKIIPCDSSEHKRAAKRPKWSVLKNTKISSCRNWTEVVEEYIKGLYENRN